VVSVSLLVRPKRRRVAVPQEPAIA